MFQEEQSPLLPQLYLSEDENSIEEFQLTEVETLPRPIPKQAWKPAPGGLITSPIFVFVAIIVGLVFIFSSGPWAPTQVTDNDETNAQEDLLQQEFVQTGVLEQQAPSTNNFVDIAIPQGRLRGYVRKSRQGREYVAYYKVPYASPPIETLRFKDPEPPQSWTGLRDEAQIAPQCIQKEQYPTPPGSIYTLGEEDCLYANIYVPNARSLQSTPTYPVMMLIHGGGMFGNGSRYGAEYFMDEDVVLITFHYRLGPLGNLNTGDDIIRGNMGFKDMVQMLKWIQENIISFGGDPKKVTIFGNSAGGMHVALLMISPMAQGLFHRAISKSGATLCANTIWPGFETRPVNSIELASKAHNCSVQTSTELLSCLRTKSASEISLGFEAAPYILTVEDRTDPVENSVFMPDKPYNLLKAGKSHALPHIFGDVNAEALSDALKLLKDKELIDNVNNDFGKYGGELFSNSYPAMNLKVSTADMISSEEMERIKEYYFGQQSIGNETLLQLTEMISDKRYVHCTFESARLHAKSGTAYLYWLTKPAKRSYVENSNPGFPAEEMGLVAHGDELQFEFLYNGYPEISSDDKKYYNFSVYLVKLWTHFAKFGNPNENDATWKAVDSENIANVTWLELNDQVQETSEMLKRMQFWDQFSPEQLKYL